MRRGDRMEPERFSELVRTLRLMKSAYPEFMPFSFADFPDLTSQQKTSIENEFGKRKIWMENSLFYNYQSEQDSDF